MSMKVQVCHLTSFCDRLSINWNFGRSWQIMRELCSFSNATFTAKLATFKPTSKAGKLLCITLNGPMWPVATPNNLVVALYDWFPELSVGFDRRVSGNRQFSLDYNHCVLKKVTGVVWAVSGFEGTKKRTKTGRAVAPGHALASNHGIGYFQTDA